LVGELVMAQANTPFDKRLKKITRKREQLAKGSVKRMRPDGLIVEEPRRFRFRFPVRGISLAVILVFLVKALFYASVGPLTYQQHLIALQGGGAFETAAAWLLYPDAVTIALGDMIAGVIR
jgi:hypothetical protein